RLAGRADCGDLVPRMPEFGTTVPGGTMVETHTRANPRLQFFYLPIVLGFLVLAGGLIYQQVLRSDRANEKEMVQNQRRIVVPGPRGNIYDRNGKLLVGNRPRFAAVLYLDELRTEFRREYDTIVKAYQEANDVDLPSVLQV